MATNAEVVFRLKADTSRIKKGLGEIQNQGKSIDKTFTSSPFFSGAIAGAAMAGVNRIIDGLSAMGREAFNVSDGWTKLDMFMTSALGSSQKEIDETISMLRELARMSIYSPDDMIQGFERLKLAGVDAADDVIKGFVDMAATLGTSSQSFQSFMIQFGQAVSKGSLKWVDLRIMMEQAPEIVDAIGKAMGMTSAEFLNSASDIGGIAMPEIIDALLKGEKGFKRFEGGATQAPKTFEAAWGAAKESITNKISDIIDTLGKKEMLENITKMGDTVVDAFDKIQKLIEFLMAHKDEVKNFAIGFSAFVTAMKGMSIIGGIIASVKELQKAEQGLSVVQALLSMINPFGWVGIAIAAAIALVALVIANWDTVKQVTLDMLNAVGAFFGEAAKVIGDTFGGIGETIGEAFDTVAETVKGVIDDIVGFFAGIGNAIVGVVSPIIDFVGGIFSALVNGILIILSPLIEFWKGVFNILVVIVQGTINIVVGIFNILVALVQIALQPIIWLFQTLISGIVAIFQGFVETMRIIFNVMMEVIKVIVSPIVDFFKVIGAGIAFAWNVVATQVGNVMKVMGTVINNVFTNIKNFLKPIIDWFVSAWKTATKGVQDAFSGMSKTVKGIFDGIVNGLKDMFNGIIGGLNWVIDGINAVPGHDKVPKIPKLAKGGIVNGPTHALIGEATPEAVVPLTPKGIAKFAKGIGLNNSNNKEITNIYNIQTDHVDEKWLEKIMKREALAQGW